MAEDHEMWRNHPMPWSRFDTGNARIFFPGNSGDGIGHRPGRPRPGPAAGCRRCPTWNCAAEGSEPHMLMDILIAIVIVVIAAILGIVVHPVLWVIVIAAALWLFGRHRSHARL